MELFKILIALLVAGGSAYLMISQATDSVTDVSPTTELKTESESQQDKANIKDKSKLNRTDTKKKQKN